MFHVVLPAAALLILGVVAADAAGPADDGNACRNSAGDNRIVACSRIIARNPGDAAAYHNRAAEYERKGDHDRAIADLDQVIRLDPKNAPAFTNRCWARNYKKEHDRAMADCDQARVIGRRSS
jgi:tetratricopeptide (TPR) repeat protein